MNPFFIYSLPRSGTAWLSVFLTAFDSYCYHEPLADMTIEHLALKFSARPDWVTGAVDTSAYQYGSMVKKALPHARQFVLRRSVDEITASSALCGVAYDAATEVGALANVTQGLPVIDYHQLRNVWYLKDLWAELIGTPFDRERAELFVEMNVQRDVRTFFANRPHLQVNPLARRVACH